jgi:uncharacterized protein (DUF1697 family)
MPELKRCFEAAGFRDVRTVLSSGNVAFSAPPASEAALERKAEAAMAKHLDRSFLTIVRSSAALRALLESDPYARFRVPTGAKRVVTFLRRTPRTRLALPPEVDGARMLEVRGREALTVYVRSPHGPVFMKLIEATLGTEVTTRTWDTVRRCAGA